MIIDNQAFREKLSTASFLIVDDEPVFTKTLSSMLNVICKFSDQEKSIHTSDKLKDALKVLMKQEMVGKPIDLVLLDLYMPHQHGVDLLRAIRNSPNSAIRDVPIIIVTAVNDKKILLDMIFEGADGFLIKPFTAKELLLKANPIMRGQWSQARPKWKKSKRKEKRLDTSRLDFNTELVFEGGSVKSARIVNISEKGARIYLAGTEKNIDIVIPEGLDFGDEDCVKAINIPAVSGNGGYKFTIETRSFPKIDLEGFDEAMIPISFHKGFPSDTTKKIWNEWLSLAKEDNLKYLEDSRKTA